MKTKLVKWTIQKKDDKDTRHIIYSEEDFDTIECDGLTKEQKLETIRSQYDSFFKTTSNIFSDTTKRWMKIGDVDVFYKGDEILIDNEMAYYYFLRNVNEVLKSPIELIVKDFMDERPKMNLDMEILKNICEKCGSVKICGACDKNFNLETPVSITTDLEKTLNAENSAHNVKLWRPESELEDGEIVSEEETDEPKDMTKDKNKTMTEKEVLDDNNNKFEEIEVSSSTVDQIKADDSFEMEVNKQFEAKTPQETKTDPSRLVYSSSDLLDIRKNAPKVPPRQNLPIIPAKIDQIRAVEVTKTPPPIPIRTKTPIHVIPPSFPEMETTLTINEQVVEQPENINLEPYTPIDRKNAGTRFKMNEMLWGNYRVKAGYSDLDDPSPDDEHSFEAVNWKAATGRQKMLNNLMTSSQNGAEMKQETKGTQNFLLNPECAFGKTQLNVGDGLKKTTSAPPVESSNWNKSKLQRKIPLPRPLRSNV